MNEPFIHKLMIGKAEEKTGWLQKPIEEQVWLSEIGLAGDEMKRSKNKEVNNQALFAYPIQHYTYWRETEGIDNIDVGAMGEHLSVLEMDEHTVCIGDIYKFGDAEIQVSQPRNRWNTHDSSEEAQDLPKRIKQTGRSGWYFRVLQEGYVLSRIDIELMERPYPEWSIAACQEIEAQPLMNLRRTRALLTCDALAGGWKRPLRKTAFGKA